MLILVLLLLAAPLFAANPSPLHELVAPYVVFDEVPVWYFKAKGESNSVVLAGNQSFTLAFAPEALVGGFRRSDFLYGHVYNRINDKLNTNYVFIRRERIKNVWYLAGYTLVVLKPNPTKAPSETVRLSRVVQRKYIRKMP